MKQKANQMSEHPILVEAMRLNIQAETEPREEKLPPILSAENSVHQNFHLTDFLQQQNKEKTSPRASSPRPCAPND